MKKIIFTIASMCSVSAFAQFNINIKTPGIESGKEVYIYTLDGSKDILFSKEKTTSNGVVAKYPTAYIGMMKAYFPDYNFTLPFISENKNIDISVQVKNGKMGEILYIDPANQIMDDIQNRQKKKSYILPALLQIAQYYKPSDDFSKALDKEIATLSQENKTGYQDHPFIDYYEQNSNRFLQKSSSVSEAEIISFITNSNDLLETSGLLRPLLMEYLNGAGTSATPEESVEKLLKSVNIETSRGQTVLSELIDIFNIYPTMDNLKNKYLKEAQNLKCSINSRLKNTINLNKSVEIGAKLENSELKNTINSTAKNIYDVKADKKVIVFWSSTCSHCEKELPQFIPVYKDLKAKNIEIIGLSFDSNKDSYTEKAKNYPWISASELNGWYSSYAQKYNIQATPIYFVLDSQNKIIAKPDRFKDVIEFLGIK